MNTGSPRPGTVLHAAPPFAAGGGFAQFHLEREIRAPGDVRLRNLRPVGPDLPDVWDRFAHWVQVAPGRILVRDLSEGGAALDYAGADRQAAAAASAMAALGAARGDAVVVLAPAGCAHAAIKLACLRAGLLHVPLSPSLTRMAGGAERLAAMIAAAAPALIVADPGCGDLPAGDVPVVAPAALLDAPGPEAPPRPGAPGAPGDGAAIYFTSGSTGTPKGVLITRGMIGAVQAGIAAHWPFLAETPPVIADWLPWHHVFGGLDNFFKMLWNGGTYNVAPAPHRDSMAASAERIAGLRPTVHVDVPFGISLLLDQLEARPDLLAGFTERLQLIFFAGAGMDGRTWSRLNHLIAAGGQRPGAPLLRLASGYGSTETGSTICLGHEQPASPGEIGVPLPGTELRLIESGGRTELRVRGPHVSPGYVDRGRLIPMPLDDEGFLPTGDTALPVRPDHPEMGLMFDGRIAEDFKLATGTRVKVGALRQLLLSACAPYLADVAIAGETRDHLAVLLFPAPEAQALSAARQHRLFQRALEDHNARWPAGSMAVRRALIAAAPPDPTRGEINDKGHLVQRRCLANRAAEVERLFARKPDAGIIVPGPRAAAPGTA